MKPNTSFFITSYYYYFRLKAIMSSSGFSSLLQLLSLFFALVQFRLEKDTHVCTKKSICCLFFDNLLVVILINFQLHAYYYYLLLWERWEHVFSLIRCWMFRLERIRYFAICYLLSISCDSIIPPHIWIFAITIVALVIYFRTRTRCILRQKWPYTVHTQIMIKDGKKMNKIKQSQPAKMG